LKESGRKGFIPFTLLGFPDQLTCLESVRQMIQAGATALELGIAFSDPLADGPTIQQAATHVINSGFTVGAAFELIKKIRDLDNNIPIGLLVYYNTILQRGEREFFRLAAQAGVDGILVVDLPPESYAQVSAIAKETGIASIFIISPLTTPERLKTISEMASGFLYAVSRLGITGTEERYDAQLTSLLEQARQSSQLPICVGFGISTPEQARKMYESGADGVITGSKIIEIVQSGNPTALATYMAEMISVANFSVVASCCQ
jgi:tryptophan synthase alpha chain